MNKNIIKFSLALVMIAHTASHSMFSTAGRQAAPRIAHTTKKFVSQNHNDSKIKTSTNSSPAESQGSYIAGTAFTLGCGATTGIAMLAVTGDPSWSLLSMPFGTMATPLFALEFKPKTFKGTLVANGIVIATIATATLLS